MSTRALYTFTDEDSSWNVYKHHDGYPSNAAVVIETALKFFAWKLPRFEADAFATAFCAACKVGLIEDTKSYGDNYCGGGSRLMPQGDPLIVATKHCCDIEYRYNIQNGPSGVTVTAWSVSIPWGDDEGKPAKAELLFSAPKKFTAAAKRWEKKAMAA